MHVARPSAALLRSTPVTYFVFDVLDVDGESVRTLPYTQRRALLEGLGVADGRRVQVPPTMTGVDGGKTRYILVMGIRDEWSAILALLRDRAPVAAATIRPARPAADRAAAEEHTTTWTAELREFYSFHDGQLSIEGLDHTTASVLPGYRILPLAEVVSEYSRRVSEQRAGQALMRDGRNDRPRWADKARTDPAGTIAHVFLEDFVPIAVSPDGSCLFVDTRPGEQQGCLRTYDHIELDRSGDSYPSLRKYLETVRLSVETNTTHSGLRPTVVDGTLLWSADAPAAQPLPAEPQVLPLPYELSYFMPSQINPDDDLIDLTVVRQTVLDTARALHPNAVIEGGRTPFPRVPRRQGIAVNSFVTVDGESKIYLTIVTGVDNDVLVYEHPPEGFAPVVDRNS